MEKHPRFLDLYHAGEVSAGDIDSYIEEWQKDGPPVALHVHLGMTWAEYGMWAAVGVLPTEAEHANLGRFDVVFVGPPDDLQPLQVHGPLRCRPACPIHWPSDHTMADRPMAWDEDRGIIMRLCRHGVSHPDPDDQQIRLHPDLAEHSSCDGCCRPTLDGDFYEEDEPLEQVLAAFKRSPKGITERPA